MAFHLQTRQELHALLITSFDLKMRPHIQPQNTVCKKKGSIQREMEKSHFSRHSSRTPVLLTSNQAGLHWLLHLAVANPQVTANFTINHDWRVPRSRFIHDTFSAHYLFLVFSFSVSLSFSLYVSLNHNSWHSLLFWLSCVYGDQSGVRL